jgi:leucyl aminopeptidase
LDRLAQVGLRAGALTTADAEVLATAVRPVDGAAVAPDGAAAALDSAYGVSLQSALERAGAKGKPGEVTEVPVPAGASAVRRVLLVGIGDGGPVAMRRAGAALARAAKTDHLATDTAQGADQDGLRAHVEGLLLGTYRFTRKSTPPDGPVLSRLDVHAATNRANEAAVEAAVRTAQATHLARDLANTPSNEKDPAWLAAQARGLARRSGLDVRIRDEKQLAAEGWGGVLGVGMGSSRPPRVIELRYRPSGRTRAPHVVLVGKGITFDSGGLSLKPREAMVPMKTDMAAGGAVIAVMSALKAAGVRVPVTGVVAAAENMPGASALRPGDVIRHYGGRTVEVFNTDAEGRLVLADALAYADEQLGPDILVDLATLTGAASIGLGRRHGALYTADEDLAGQLLAAGDASGERLWRMPLVDDYRPALDSTVADLANISRDPAIQGGSIIAALFLREFVGARRWAHLDIAGPARSERDEHEVSKGATGFATRLLLRWLEGLR